MNIHTILGLDYGVALLLIFFFVVPGISKQK